MGASADMITDTACPRDLHEYVNASADVKVRLPW